MTGAILIVLIVLIVLKALLLSRLCLFAKISPLVLSIRAAKRGLLELLKVLEGCSEKNTFNSTLS